ncbi:hypothetical protein [Kutzneria sp. CA-103260]|uniref:hypothetical protein n=1 Tax=Kutzneria sp. CA-103260 TaxID=2802641 RepID=UPI001BA4F9F7|nr:hypothetical protein [Kutzneria sp. CA-103260]QUQ64469.1 hypothetical protein JJ691_21890 [Kutzneria sp. CA-103260]
MLELGNARRTVALAASAIALAGGATVGLGVAAAYADGDCGASWNNVGSPANMYLTDGITYVGQVEQQYQNCGGGVVNARSHFQWAGSFQNSHPGDEVDVWEYSPYSNDTGSQWYYTYSKDAYSYPVEIHQANPDNWQARAALNGCGDYAQGTYWAYRTGTPLGGEQTGYCPDV